jgi:Tol biopolymer transport system component
MAYVQAESERTEVFVQAISPSGPATGIKYRISSAGGDRPKWRRDGKELVYVSADSKMIGVPVTLGATVQIGTPQTLFELPQGATAVDMTDDAQRFLINVPVGGAARANALTVVLNWQAGLKK